jgi:aryl-phospho-beta-D-glucosidase BglC (GH1 family)
VSQSNASNSRDPYPQIEIYLRYPKIAMRLGFTSFSALLILVNAWLPSDRNLFNLSASNPDGKIRGVNLGSTFVIEPWMALNSWNNMGCGDSKAEFDCVAKIGQTKANAVWETHWSNWITESDITAMANYGLNSVRIPLGYWMDESIVALNETFPQGGFEYLERICGWASDHGFYIMLDMHGAPGSQRREKPSPGQVS